jgi:hypothetical protein
MMLTWLSYSVHIVFSPTCVRLLRDAELEEKLRRADGNESEAREGIRHSQAISGCLAVHVAGLMLIGGFLAVVYKDHWPGAVVFAYFVWLLIGCFVHIFLLRELFLKRLN